MEKILPRKISKTHFVVDIFDLICDLPSSLYLDCTRRENGLEMSDRCGGLV